MFIKEYPWDQHPQLPFREVREARMEREMSGHNKGPRVVGTDTTGSSRGPGELSGLAELAWPFSSLTDWSVGANPTSGVSGDMPAQLCQSLRGLRARLGTDISGLIDNANTNGALFKSLQRLHCPSNKVHTH